jgi:hypothetical protein
MSARREQTGQESQHLIALIVRDIGAPPDHLVQFARPARFSEPLLCDEISLVTDDAFRLNECGFRSGRKGPFGGMDVGGDDWPIRRSS